MLRKYVHVLCVAISAAGCAAPFPVNRNEVLTFSRSAPALTAGDPGYESTLQIQWLGTACYLIQLGDLAILTDPFFTHHDLWDVAFGRVSSDPAIVAAKTAALRKPQAIFVGHSHYDHMLDLAETIRQRNWFDVPTYGSVTTQNILHGYGADMAAYAQGHSLLPQTDEALPPVEIVPGLRYRAIESMHAPHFDGITFFSGSVDASRTTPPTRAEHFKLGATYNFLFELTNTVNGVPVVFTVFMTGAASDYPVGLPSGSIPPIDVAIVTVPGWKNVSGYPQKFVERLTPHHVLLSHYNDFFDTTPETRRVVPTAHLSDFLSIVRDSTINPELRQVWVPDVDARIHITKN